MSIDVKNLNYYYGDFPALKNLTFSVATGNFFIVIGPNGSGKTTLLKMMAGILKSQIDQLMILNRPIDQYSRKALARTLANTSQKTR